MDLIEDTQSPAVGLAGMYGLNPMSSIAQQKYSMAQRNANSSSRAITRHQNKKEPRGPAVRLPWLSKMGNVPIPTRWLQAVWTKCRRLPC